MSDTFNKFRSTIIQSVFYSIGNFFGKFSGVILLPIYLLYLPVDVFGLFALFEGLFQIFQIFSGLGVKLGFARWYWDKEQVNNKKSLFFTTLLFNSLVCVVFSIILYFGFNFLSQYYFKSLISNELALLFIGGNLLKLLSEVPMLLLRAQHRAKKHSIVQIIQLISYVLFVYLFLAWFDMKLAGLFWAVIISASIQLLLLIKVVYENIEFKFNIPLLKEIISYGFPVALGNMVNQLFVFTDKYFINLFSNLKNVGTFTLAHKVSNIVNLLVVNAFMNAYMHSYFKGADEEDSEHFFSRSFTYFLLVITFCSLLLILFIKEALLVFNADKTAYGESAVIVPVLSVGLIFGGIRQMFTLPINKVKKTKVIGVLSIVAGAVNVILNYLFIPKWHALGAAYATGVVQILSSIVLLYYGLKYLNFKLEWKRIGILFFNFLIILIAFYSFQFEFFFYNILYKVFLVVVWFVVGYISGFLLDVEKQRIVSFWKKWGRISAITNNIKSLKH